MRRNQLIAKQVINPEYEYGKKFANKILFKSIFLDNNADELELFVIPSQPFMIGKTLIELQLPDKYNVIVAAVMKDGKYTRPIPNEKLQNNDRLLITGTNEDIERMMKENH